MYFQAPVLILIIINFTIDATDPCLRNHAYSVIGCLSETKQSAAVANKFFQFQLNKKLNQLMRQSTNRS
jgi:hypothetical protein